LHPSPSSPPPGKPPSSAALNWPPIAHFIDREARLADTAERRGPLALGVYEFIRFGVKQGWACLFGGAMLALIIATHLWYPSRTPIARYDALVAGALAIQVILLATRLERWDEALAILVFHIVGTTMEVFKTAIGSWIYPEASVLHIGGVPLFTGFMYAAIGSYLARVWRLFDFRFTHHPSLIFLATLSMCIYINFFSHHFLPDVRYILILATCILFGRTTVYFRVWKQYRHMPLLLGFLLVALFIWFAENIGTGMNVWRYPSQRHHWAMVPVAKLQAWFLLMIVSYTLVAFVTRPRPLRDRVLTDSYAIS
jgi:uncharacterized membrane protein YoaT (DUF817 family)